LRGRVWWRGERAAQAHVLPHGCRSKGNNKNPNARAAHKQRAAHLHGDARPGAPAALQLAAEVQHAGGGGWDPQVWPRGQVEEVDPVVSVASCGARMHAFRCVEACMGALPLHACGRCCRCMRAVLQVHANAPCGAAAGSSRAAKRRLTTGPRRRCGPPPPAAAPSGPAPGTSCCGRTCGRRVHACMRGSPAVSQLRGRADETGGPPACMRMLTAAICMHPHTCGQPPAACGPSPPRPFETSAQTAPQRAAVWQRDARLLGVGGLEERLHVARVVAQDHDGAAARGDDLGPARVDEEGGSGRGGAGGDAAKWLASARRCCLNDSHVQLPTTPRTTHQKRPASGSPWNTAYEQALDEEVGSSTKAFSRLGGALQRQHAGAGAAPCSAGVGGGGSNRPGSDAQQSPSTASCATVNTLMVEVLVSCAIQAGTSATEAGREREECAPWDAKQGKGGG